MKPPPPFPPPPDHRGTDSPRAAGALWVLTWLCAVPIVLGVGYALAAAAPANRAATPFADLGVTMGLGLAGLGAVGALVFGLAARSSGPRGGLG